jgi:hypothetical protein
MIDIDAEMAIWLEERGLYDDDPATVVERLRPKIFELELENAALLALVPGVSHGFIHLRAHVDPQAPRKPKPEEFL